MTGGRSSAVLTIDVAHPPLSSADAERALDDVLRKAELSGGPRIIRVIHGYGSGGKGGTLRTTVRNWAYRRRERIGLALPGEEYSPFEPKVQKYLLEAGISPAEIGPGDPGFTLILLP